MDRLWTPWRYQYISGDAGPKEADDACVFCALAADESDGQPTDSPAGAGPTSAGDPSTSASGLSSSPPGGQDNTGGGDGGQNPPLM